MQSEENKFHFSLGYLPDEPLMQYKLPEGLSRVDVPSGPLSEKNIAPSLPNTILFGPYI